MPDDDFDVDAEEFDLDDDMMKEIENSQGRFGEKANGNKQGNTKSTPTKTTASLKKENDKGAPTKRKLETISSDDDEFIELKPAATGKKSTPKKPKLSESTAAVMKEPDVNKTPTKASAPSKTPSKPMPRVFPKSAARGKKEEDAEEDIERKAILKNVETVDLPDVLPASGEMKYSILLLQPNS